MTHRQKFCPELQRKVLYLRFGSLEDISCQIRTPTTVFKMTGVKLSTQYMMIKRWLERGKRIVSMVGTKPKARMLNYDQEAYLANPETLESMRHMGLI